MRPWHYPTIAEVNVSATKGARWDRGTQLKEGSDKDGESEDDLDDADLLHYSANDHGNPAADYQQRAGITKKLSNSPTVQSPEM